MPEMHLRHPASPDKSGFTYSACGTFIRNKKKSKTLKKQEFMVYLSKRTR